jgi:hypothetical protein
MDCSLAAPLSSAASLRKAEFCMIFRRPVIALAAVALTLSVSWSSQAHEEIEPGWCSTPHDEIKIIETFDFDKHELYEIIVAHTHGVVDLPRDHWSPVSIAIGDYCQDLARGYDSRAIITGPESYLSPKHHEIYRISDGLVGGCGICIPREQP